MDRICSVSVDPKAKTVTCGGGVTVGMVDAATRTRHGPRTASAKILTYAITNDLVPI